MCIFNYLLVFNKLRNDFGERVLPEEPKLSPYNPTPYAKSQIFCTAFVPPGEISHAAARRLPVLADRGFCTLVVTVYARHSARCRRGRRREGGWFTSTKSSSPYCGGFLNICSTVKMTMMGRPSILSPRR